MKTYEINVLLPNEEATVQAVSTHFVSTDASKLDVQKAIDFVKLGDDKSIEKLLIALRVLGFKAREVKVQAEEVFDL